MSYRPRSLQLLKVLEQQCFLLLQSCYPAKPTAHVCKCMGFGNTSTLCRACTAGLHMHAMCSQKHTSSDGSRVCPGTLQCADAAPHAKSHLIRDHSHGGIAPAAAIRTGADWSAAPCVKPLSVRRRLCAETPACNRLIMSISSDLTQLLPCSVYGAVAPAITTRCLLSRMALLLKFCQNCSPQLLYAEGGSRGEAVPGA